MNSCCRHGSKNFFVTPSESRLYVRTPNVTMGKRALDKSSFRGFWTCHFEPSEIKFKMTPRTDANRPCGDVRGKNTCSFDHWQNVAARGSMSSLDGGDIKNTISFARGSMLHPPPALDFNKSTRVSKFARQTLKNVAMRWVWSLPKKDTATLLFSSVEARLERNISHRESKHPTASSDGHLYE